MLPLKGVIPLAAQGEGWAEMRGYTCTLGTTTASRTTPRWPPLLPEWDSYQRGLGIRYSWSSLDPTVPKELLKEYRALFVPPSLGNFIPSQCQHQAIPLFLPIPQDIWVGKSIKGCGWGLRCWKCCSQAGGERWPATPALPTHSLGCWRMHRDMGGCRDQKDGEKLVTKGWQL